MSHPAEVFSPSNKIVPAISVYHTAAIMQDREDLVQGLLSPMSLPVM